MIIIRSKQNDPALEEQILALLRREHIQAEQFSLSTQQLLSIRGLTIDGGSRQVTCQGQKVTVTRMEFDLLLFLAENVGKGLTKGDIFRAVWGKDSADTMKVVANTISNLRRKIGTAAITSKPSPAAIASQRSHFSERAKEKNQPRRGRLG